MDVATLRKGMGADLRRLGRIVMHIHIAKIDPGHHLHRMLDLRRQPARPRGLGLKGLVLIGLALHGTGGGRKPALQRLLIFQRRPLNRAAIGEIAEMRQTLDDLPAIGPALQGGQMILLSGRRPVLG